MSSPRPRLEFGRLACTAGLGPCHCALCQLEDLDTPVEPEGVDSWIMETPAGRYRVLGSRYDHARDYQSGTPITSFSQGTADTISNAARCRTETQMENLNLFNPRATDGALLWVALRMIPVSMILAGLFAALS